VCIPSFTFLYPSYNPVGICHLHSCTHLTIPWAYAIYILVPILQSRGHMPFTFLYPSYNPVCILSFTFLYPSHNPVCILSFTFLYPSHNPVCILSFTFLYPSHNPVCPTQPQTASHIDYHPFAGLQALPGNKPFFTWLSLFAHHQHSCYVARCTLRPFLCLLLARASLPCKESSKRPAPLTCYHTYHIVHITLLHSTTTYHRDNSTHEATQQPQRSEASTSITNQPHTTPDTRQILRSRPVLHHETSLPTNTSPTAKAHRKLETPHTNPYLTNTMSIELDPSELSFQRKSHRHLCRLFSPFFSLRPPPSQHRTGTGQLTNVSKNRPFHQGSRTDIAH
jgi:hypothetical protein